MLSLADSSTVTRCARLHEQTDRDDPTDSRLVSLLSRKHFSDYNAPLKGWSVPTMVAGRLPIRQRSSVRWSKKVNSSESTTLLPVALQCTSNCGTGMQIPVFVAVEQQPA
ncbi:hypothetical protein TNCV_1383701 [Trichonephila clavipes]|nr:hypothetical protein TNCV_1383701 [Trichonephila clavipes]